MKFERKYPAVHTGAHAPDKRLYRSAESRICANCGEQTEWTDTDLAMSICLKSASTRSRRGAGH
jgi:hypothetical protein